MYSDHAMSIHVLLVLAALFFMRTVLRSISRKSLSLPPGPKGLPLVGNVLDMPSEKEWLTFARWGETWGKSACPSILRLS